MPPAAAQRLKQRGRVGIASGLGLDQIDARLLVGLFGVQQSEIAGVAVLPLPLRQVQRDFGRIRGVRGGLQCFGILLKAVRVSATF